jgi:hypothetical protein
MPISGPSHLYLPESWSLLFRSAADYRLVGQTVVSGKALLRFAANANPVAARLDAEQLLFGVSATQIDDTLQGERERLDEAPARVEFWLSGPEARLVQTELTLPMDETGDSGLVRMKFSRYNDVQVDVPQ